MSAQKIMVIEDDLSTLLALKCALTIRGYKVIFAVHAADAVALSSKERPDLIITDIGRPNASGFSVINRVRHILPLLDAPIIVLTARASPAYEQLALETGAAAFFAKPANVDAICATVDSLISARRCQPRSCELAA